MMDDDESADFRKVITLMLKQAACLYGAKEKGRKSNK